jgi:glycerophosphoryl diester phosphodiesterase
MADGIAVVRGGHRTLLKWHRARKAAGDLPFTGARILEGLRLGASVEVDLVKHADGGFAVLHDFALDRATTGAGPVAASHAPELRRLQLRGEDGRPTTHPVMLLEDLCELLRDDVALAPDGVLQLDLKEEAPGAIGPAEVEGFAAAVAPVAQHFILSGGSASNVAALASAVPGLATGFDPCSAEALGALEASRDFAGFVAEAVAAAPAAAMIYLEHRLVLAAAEAGFDLVAAFHSAARRVDAYTLRLADAETLALARRLLALAVDQITTDDPVGLEVLLDA